MAEGSERERKKEGTTSGSPSPLLALKNQNHAIHKLLEL